MANKWTAFSNLPSGLSPDTMFLLTDGTVLVHNANGKEWYRLTPDAKGDYETGTWSKAINMANTRQFFASGILRDGRVFAIGGEYSDSADVGKGTVNGEIFDPLGDGGRGAWSAIDKPSSFGFINKDADSCILADGRVLLGDVNSQRTAIWDPDTDSWTEAGLGFGTLTLSSKQGFTDEETWVLLPDGSVLTVQITGGPRTERYVPATDLWTFSGNTQTTLPLVSLNDPVTKSTVNISEIGPALLLPGGTVFWVGGTGRTGIYTLPTTPSDTGSWAAGASFPPDTSGNNYNQVNGNFQTAIDAPAVVLPNGKVLAVAGNTVREGGAGGSVQFWSRPCTVYVYDPATDVTPVALAPQPPNNGVDTWQARLLLLPNGKVLFSTQQSSLAILTVDPATADPDATWKPTIISAPNIMVGGHTYVISGTQINGLSQAVSYGDDAPAATNYPIARLTKTGGNAVHYLRTFDFSTLGVATGTDVHSTSVQVPDKVPAGQYKLEVIANGIPSDPLDMHVAARAPSSSSTAAPSVRVRSRRSSTSRAPRPSSTPRSTSSWRASSPASWDSRTAISATRHTSRRSRARRPTSRSSSAAPSSPRTPRCRRSPSASRSPTRSSSRIRRACSASAPAPRRSRSTPPSR
ncbi:MAG: hypothetical protein DLM67_09605 [Candidatus Nephthysia bennettiae]|uniref:Uncharacterized protein n=1 Tax=Candidatus Nephthysia bennettiae TaxID=3127016 RepID=A0A934K6H8_9BACT|nr:hypothetical protein [Candidatus Dormibacteraeota bacterium]MBJ7613306.1 hypothetical protein [Candidatus Dormibacteraeota bacterium]PZR96325.1 MAG: hypothetical protein DLM67_09605 [Candidatus Dormibacteraeota bacterium]